MRSSSGLSARPKALRLAFPPVCARPVRAAVEPPVTVAVVSHNTRELLGACLDSLAPDVEAGRAAVWVVDNASTDGSPDAVREGAPWAHLIAHPRNLGFGPAVNLVAERTDSPWLVASNADVAPLPGALDELLGAGEDEARIGAVAPRLILPDGRTQQSVYAFPTLAFTLLFNLGAQRLSHRLGDRLCLHGYWDPARPRDVDWAIGAFLLIRRAAFDEVGGFDSGSWMYAEDLDLGWRLREAGWRTRYEPRAPVRHTESAATGVAFGETRIARHTAAAYRVMLIRRGLVRTRATAAISVAGAAVRVVALGAMTLVSRRWRGPRDEARRWLAAHLQGLAPRHILERHR